MFKQVPPITVVTFANLQKGAHIFLGCELQGRHKKKGKSGSVLRVVPIVRLLTICEYLRQRFNGCPGIRQSSDDREDVNYIKLKTED